MNAHVHAGFWVLSMNTNIFTGSHQYQVPMLERVLLVKGSIFPIPSQQHKDRKKLQIDRKVLRECGLAS